MADPIAFYFDFSSPYGYLASTRIDALAEKHGRMGHLAAVPAGRRFQDNRATAARQQPLRGPYSLHDFARSARLLGVRFRLPEPFPFPSLAACRAFYWLADRDAAQAKALARCRLPRRLRPRPRHARLPRRWPRWRSRSASIARPCSRPSTTRP